MLCTVYYNSYLFLWTTLLNKIIVVKKKIYIRYYSLCQGGGGNRGGLSKTLSVPKYKFNNERLYEMRCISWYSVIIFYLLLFLLTWRFLWWSRSSGSRGGRSISSGDWRNMGFIRCSCSSQLFSRVFRWGSGVMAALDGMSLRPGIGKSYNCDD